MKVARYYDQNDIRLQEMQIPKITSHEALVEMKACGLCGSDLLDWYLKDRTPIVLGHEPSGIIVKVGKDVTDFQVGDRVFVHHHVACLTCHLCLRGAYTLCDQFKNSHIYPGGFAEYFRVSAAHLKIDTLILPDKLSFTNATLIEPIACVLRSLAKHNIEQVDTIAIIGVGISGLLHTLLAQSHGIGTIIVCDLVDYRLDIAKRLGADILINPNKENMITRIREITDNRGADAIIITVPDLQVIASGINVCSQGGIVSIYAPLPPKDVLQLNVNDFFFSEKKLVFSYSASHIETRRALKLLSCGKLQTSELITHFFPLKKTQEAFNTAITNMKSLKIVVKGKS